MSKWAEAFQASLARHDTADTCDSSAPAAPLQDGSVTTVSSVTAAGEPGKLQPTQARIDHVSPEAEEAAAATAANPSMGHDTADSCDSFSSLAPLKEACVATVSSVTACGDKAKPPRDAVSTSLPGSQNPQDGLPEVTVAATPDLGLDGSEAVEINRVSSQAKEAVGDTTADTVMGHDTADSRDSSSVTGLLNGGCVATVSSVTASREVADDSEPTSEQVALALADHPLVRSIKASFPGVRINAMLHDARADAGGPSVAGLANAMQRPPAWADPAAAPTHGCWCRCCRGSRWWTERETPKGWRCWTCHPPDHLPADERVEVAFVRLSDILR